MKKRKWRGGRKILSYLEKILIILSLAQPQGHKSSATSKETRLLNVTP